MKRIIAASLMGMLAGTLMAADAAKDEVKAAVKKLTENSYSWKSTVQVPEGSQFRPGPTEGKMSKEGIMFLTMTRGENTTEAVLKGEKGAVKTQEGWKSVEELTSGDAQQNRGAFAARMLRGYRSPSAQVETLLAQCKELSKADGVCSADLTEAGAKELLSFGRRPGGQAPEPKGAKGSVKIWLKDGNLAKYEFRVQGTVSGRDNQEFEVDRTTTIEIKDVGTTAFEVPADAKKLL
jgi:hypothetical protein